MTRLTRELQQANEKLEKWKACADRFIGYLSSDRSQWSLVLSKTPPHPSPAVNIKRSVNESIIKEIDEMLETLTQLQQP